MNSAPAITQDGGVVVQGDALPLLYRAVLALAARHNRDGITPPPLLHTLRAALFRATTMSPPRHLLDETPAAKSRCDHQHACDDWCTTGEAALLLGLSRRSVQRMARAPGGLDAIRVGRTWLVRRTGAAAGANERKAT